MSENSQNGRHSSSYFVKQTERCSVYYHKTIKSETRSIPVAVDHFSVNLMNDLSSSLHFLLESLSGRIPASDLIVKPLVRNVACVDFVSGYLVCSRAQCINKEGNKLFTERFASTASQCSVLSQFMFHVHKRFYPPYSF